MTLFGMGNSGVKHPYGVHTPNGHKKGCGHHAWCSADIHHGPLPDSRIDMPETLESTPPSPTTSAGAQKPMGRPSLETDAARRRPQGAAELESIREYELIWLLQQRLRAVSWPHWRLRCMKPLHGHGMGVVRP